MLAPPIPTRSPERVDELIRDAVADTSGGRLPGKELSELAQEKVQRLNPGETAPLGHPPGSAQEQQQIQMFDASKMELSYGRYFWPGTPISRPDPLWSPADIVAFEFLMAQRLGSMLVVAGEWCEVLPAPGYELMLDIPYIVLIPIIAPSQSS